MTISYCMVHRLAEVVIMSKPSLKFEEDRRRAQVAHAVIVKTGYIFASIPTASHI